MKKVILLVVLLAVLVSPFSVFAQGSIHKKPFCPAMFDEEEGLLLSTGSDIWVVNGAEVWMCHYQASIGTLIAPAGCPEEIVYGQPLRIRTLKQGELGFCDYDVVILDNIEAWNRQVPIWIQIFDIIFIDIPQVRWYVSLYKTNQCPITIEGFFGQATLFARDETNMGIMCSYTNETMSTSLPTDRAWEYAISHLPTQEETHIRAIAQILSLLF